MPAPSWVQVQCYGLRKRSISLPRCQLCGCMQAAFTGGYRVITKFTFNQHFSTLTVHP